MFRTVSPTVRERAKCLVRCEELRGFARAHVAAGMEAFYQLPYERFEKWSPFGAPEQIADFLQPYMEAGCSIFNLIIQGPSVEEEIDAAAEIRQLMLER